MDASKLYFSATKTLVHLFLTSVVYRHCYFSKNTFILKLSPLSTVISHYPPVALT